MRRGVTNGFAVYEYVWFIEKSRVVLGLSIAAIWEEGFEGFEPELGL